MGAYFEEQVKILIDLPIVGDVLGHKYMMCIENVADKQTKELIDSAAKVGNRIADHCQARGLIVLPLAHMNMLSPPSTLNKENIDFLVVTLSESIEATMADLKAEGYL
ncbi:hypothetical protein [Microbulbifer sp. YPW1]|uniref:hypothetical protein n=1 Tax=Microbulbifer sp. YPW1 TaxID=2745199 RepID=UPI001C635868|nr:hypothetical protein [Microbulbifer sp. YPW1]